MNFWTFLDRNGLWVFFPVLLLVVAVVHDCRDASPTAHPGCGVSIHIDSKPSDAGAD